jgi:hypothetical protein
LLNRQHRKSTMKASSTSATYGDSGAFWSSVEKFGGLPVSAMGASVSISCVSSCRLPFELAILVHHRISHDNWGSVQLDGCARKSGSQ